MLPEIDVEKLNSLRSILVRRIKLEDGVLLQELLCRGVITEEQVQTIEKTRGDSKQVGKLLDFLSNGDATTVNKFASALRTSGYAELADKCYEETTSAGIQESLETLDIADRPSVRPKVKQPEAKTLQHTSQKAETGMSLRCQLAIQKSYSEFVQDLDVGPTLDYLLSELILTPDECQRIRSRREVNEKRRELLDLLPQKGQRAFDGLCAYLPSNQPWLLVTLIKNKENITEAELAEAKEGQHAEFGKGLTRRQLQGALRKNVLKYVQNDPSRILTEPKTAPGPYLTQSITAYKVTDGRQREEMDVTDVFELLEKCPSDHRLFIEGTAGMGKSSLCREIGKVWAQGDIRLCNKFRFVLPIPLRLVRSRTLLDIICDDAKLLPSSCKERLGQEIDLNPEQFLFVLDSFEELGHTGQDEEIIKLIKGDVLRESAVLLTTRPNTEVEKLEKGVHSRIHASLQNLTKKQVESYIENFPDLESNSRVNVGQKFGGAFLERPINLWLLCYVAVTTMGLGLRLPGSQTVLLNIIMQHLLLVYQKKRNLPGFELTERSPLTIPGHDEVKSMLKEAGRLCYVAVREKTHLIDVTESVLSKEGLLELGLFAQGSKENTVVLPHQLFKEYLAALYLSAEKTARDDLTSQLKVKSVTQSPRPCLVDMLRSLHLDNVVRFLVGLLPASVDQLAKMFAIKQSRVRIVDKITGPGIRAKDEKQTTETQYMHSFLHYELDLFHECSDLATQKALAVALLNADITTYTGHDDYVPNRGSNNLLNCYTADQREEFLGKFYNCQLLVKNGQTILKMLREGSTFFCDSFVAGLIMLHNCQVEMEELWFYNAFLSVQLIAHHMRVVQRLYIKHSTLYSYEDKAEFVTSRGLQDSQTGDMSEELATTSQSAVGVLGVDNVRGLRQFASKYVMPATRGLSVFMCDATLAQVSMSFPAVRRLRLGWQDDKFFSHHAQTRLTSVKTLTLARCDNVDFTNLRQSFPRLEALNVIQTTLLTDDRPMTWSTLLRLALNKVLLRHNNNVLSREMAIHILARICPHAELEITVYADEEKAAYRDKYYKVYRKYLMAVHDQ